MSQTTPNPGPLTVVLVHGAYADEMWTTTVIMLLGRLMGKVCGLRCEVISVKRDGVRTIQCRRAKQNH